jgi:hypothetical protein
VKHEDTASARYLDVMSIEIGVAEAKRRFSELADRVGDGESFVVMNRT